MSYYSSRRPAQGRNFRTRRPVKKAGGNKQYIDPSKFVRPAKPVQQDQYQPVHQFEDFALHPLLKRNVTTKGFKTPSKIQDMTIPHGLEGKDVVGIANTGTGKTAAFGLPLLHTLMQNQHAKALIIAPTRELAIQIEDELGSFALDSRLRDALLIGGSSMYRQIVDLRRKPQIVIGTPGRIKDHVQRGNLNLGVFNVIVLDEVDRMVDMGFIRDITFLLGELAPVRQSLFFSATMDKNVEGLMQQFLTNPIMVQAKTGDTSDHVEQDVVRYARLDKEDKIEKLHDVLIGEQVIKTIVFDETKRSVERLSKELASRGFKADALHGGKTQSQRERAMKRFRQNDINVLVATDVAARGIDVADISHVINYATPNSYDDYVHRVGRAGRAGRQGYALTFIPH